MTKSECTMSLDCSCEYCKLIRPIREQIIEVLKDSKALDKDEPSLTEKPLKELEK